ncbi:MAG: orotate phosphoribosyltransferase [Candidatus Sumerlaeota bacterium]|nr:orotate phosphoribosyltransferase [Candidatus Sumerlaeota bacterium]
MPVELTIAPEARDILVGAGALLEGHFKLTSGKHSPYYVQCAQLFAQPPLARKAAAELAARIGRLEVDFTLAPAMGGIIAGYEVAAELGCRALFAERPSGPFELRRGFALRPGERVLVVEDVITTGGSVLEVAQLARAHGAIVAGYATFIDRSGGSFHPAEPVWSWTRIAAPVYDPAECPLCAAGSQAVKPGSRPE